MFGKQVKKKDFLGKCYAENAICCINKVMTTVKGFQGRSRIIANIIIGCIERSSVYKRP